VASKAPKKAAPKKKAPVKKAAKKKPAARKVKARAIRDLDIKPVQGGLPKPDVTEVIHRINMVHGQVGPVIQRARNTWNTFDLRRPSGIMSIDIATGGGLPSCGLSQLDGTEGVGKNFLIYHYMAECQRLYGDRACIAMASLETPMDKRFAQKCGVQIAMSAYDIEVENRARRKRGESPMDNLEVREARDTPGMGEFLVLDQGGSENIMNGIIELVGHNICQIIGLDSWDAVQTYLEREKSLGEHAQRASVAQLQTFFAKKLSDEGLPAIYRCADCSFAPLKQNISDVKALRYTWVCPNCQWSGLEPVVELNETTLIAIKQVRGKMDTFGKGKGRPYGTGGAHALRHQNLVRLTLYPGARIPESSSKPKIGKEVNWEITKGKCGCHEGAKGTFKLYFDKMQVDVYDDLLAQCTRHKVVTLGGSYYKADCLEVRVKGRDQFLRLIEENPDYWDILRDRLYIETGLSHVRLR